MMTILLDVDGVLADFVAAYLGLLKDTLGIDATPDQVTAWDIGEALGLTREQSSQVKRAIGTSPQLARSLPIYPGAIEGVERLKQLGEIYIVTSPWNSNPTWTHDREEWLYRNFGIPYNRVIHTSAKYLVRGDVFIDDKASAVAKWRDAHPSGLPVLWSNLHNRTELWDGQCTGDWSFLCELVEGLAL
jgi:5'(3')-deoxyribonucleotidase